MNRDMPYNKSGPYCNRTWDGWMCWDDTRAGTYTSQNCPSFFPDFDPTEKVTKYCDEMGNWFRHPDTNRTWSNYTLCIAYTKEKLRMAYILYYMAIVGHALSIASLLISLAIFFYFRSLSCQRITLHKNLFCSYVLNSTFTIINLITVVNNPKVVERNPVGCKVLHFFHMYMLGCNYFWMLCEGIYLHTLIVVAVFAEEQHLHWYYLLGWGFPLVPTSIHAVARKKYFDDNCWMSVETHLLYVVHGPIVAALLVNLFFLLNIVRVLVTKLRDTHRAESNMYMKAVRATLILVPLLGIQFVILLWRPENRLAGEIYDFIMHILMHYQVVYPAWGTLLPRASSSSDLTQPRIITLIHLNANSIVKRASFPPAVYNFNKPLPICHMLLFYFFLEIPYFLLKTLYFLSYCNPVCLFFLVACNTSC
uniref:Calcitonin receptor n=1 Tax=Denticeps clupeoides TaxID=299321 RepID=A0AAY4ECU8_9TELE